MCELTDSMFEFAGIAYVDWRYLYFD